MDEKVGSRSCADFSGGRMMKMEGLAVWLQVHVVVDGFLCLSHVLVVAVPSRACRGCVLLRGV